MNIALREAKQVCLIHNLKKGRNVLQHEKYHQDVNKIISVSEFGPIGLAITVMRRPCSGHKEQFHLQHLLPSPTMYTLGLHHARAV